MESVDLITIIKAIQKEMATKDFKKTFLYQIDYIDNADMKLLFNVCDKTLYRWRSKLAVPHTKIEGKIVYPRQAIKGMLEQRIANQYVSHFNKKAEE